MIVFFEATALPEPFSTFSASTSSSNSSKGQQKLTSFHLRKGSSCGLSSATAISCHQMLVAFFSQAPSSGGSSALIFDQAANFDGAYGCMPSFCDRFVDHVLVFIRSQLVRYGYPLFSCPATGRSLARLEGRQAFFLCPH